MGTLALPPISGWSLGSGISAMASGGAQLTKGAPSACSDQLTSFNSATWTKFDSGSKLSFGAGGLSISGNSSWTTNGLIGKTSLAAAAGLEFRYAVKPVASESLYAGCSDSSSSLHDPGAAGYQGCMVLFSTTIKVFINGTQYGIIAGSGLTSAKTYNLRIVCLNPGWSVYVQSSDDSTYSIESLLCSVPVSSTGPFYPQVSKYTTSTALITNVSCGLNFYSSASPVAETPWVACPYKTLDVSAAVAAIENSLGGGGGDRELPWRRREREVSVCAQ